jgi:hypothetical protein
MPMVWLELLLRVGGRYSVPGRAELDVPGRLIAHTLISRHGRAYRTNGELGRRKSLKPSFFGLAGRLP